MAAVEDVAQGALQSAVARRGRAHDADLPIRRVQRGKVGQSLHMIPVGVREAQCAVARLFPKHGVAQGMDARARIDDDSVPGIGTHFHTGGVAAVASRVQRRHRDGAARTP